MLFLYPLLATLLLATNSSHAMEVSNVVTIPTILARVCDNALSVSMPPAILNLNPQASFLAGNFIFTEDKEKEIIIELADDHNPDFSLRDLTELSELLGDSSIIFNTCRFSLEILKRLCLAADKLNFEDPKKIPNSLFARYAVLARKTSAGISPTMENILKNRSLSIADVVNIHETIDIPEEVCRHTNSSCSCNPKTIDIFLEKIIEGHEHWLEFLDGEQLNFENLTIKSVHGLTDFLNILKITKSLIYFYHSQYNPSYNFCEIVKKSSHYEILKSKSGQIAKLATYVKELKTLNLSHNQLSNSHFINKLSLSGININHNNIRDFAIPQLAKELTIDASHNPISTITVPKHLCHYKFILKLQNTALNDKDRLMLRKRFDPLYGRDSFANIFYVFTRDNSHNADISRLRRGFVLFFTSGMFAFSKNALLPKSALSVEFMLGLAAAYGWPWKFSAYFIGDLGGKILNLLFDARRFPLGLRYATIGTVTVGTALLLSKLVSDASLRDDKEIITIEF
jgi:hypothetical protein